jgi:hypothetical protein
MEPEQTDVDRVHAMLSQSGGVGRASVRIFKIDAGKSVFCESYQPADFQDGDFSMIRDAFGPGQYKIMLYGEHPDTGTFGILTRTEITLAENRINKVLAQQAPAVDSGLAAVLSQLAKGQETMLTALMEVKQAPPADPMANMTQMFSMMGLMREAMGLNNKPEKQSNIGELLGALRELRGAAKELVPDGGDKEPDSLLSLAPQMLELIKTSMANQNATPAAPANAAQIMRPLTIPESVSASPTIPTTAPAENDMNALEIVKLYAHLDTLIGLAKSDASPNLGAELIYEKLPDDLIDMLAEPSWFEALTQLRGGVAPYREWFTKARDLVTVMFQEDAAQDAAEIAAQSAAAPAIGQTNPA